MNSPSCVTLITSRTASFSPLSTKIEDLHPGTRKGRQEALVEAANPSLVERLGCHPAEDHVFRVEVEIAVEVAGVEPLDRGAILVAEAHACNLNDAARAVTAKASRLPIAAPNAG